MASLSSTAVARPAQFSSTSAAQNTKSDGSHSFSVSYSRNGSHSSKVVSIKSNMFTPLAPFYSSSKSTSPASSHSRCVVKAAVIQFIRGIDEQTVPDVKLTRARDGSSGTALFSFEQPSVFDSSKELGDITGLYMIDEEGVLQTVDVSAKFVNGKPSRVEAYFVMRSEREWDRFLRFMERYAEKNNLGFSKN